MQLRDLARGATSCKPQRQHSAGHNPASRQLGRAAWRQPPSYSRSQCIITENALPTIAQRSTAHTHTCMWVLAEER